MLSHFMCTYSERIRHTYKMSKFALIFSTISLLLAVDMASGSCTVFKNGTCRLEHCKCLKKDASLDISPDADCGQTLRGSYSKSECAQEFHLCLANAGCSADNKDSTQS